MTDSTGPTSPPPPLAADRPGNGKLVLWLIRLGLARPWQCARLLGLNLVVMAASLAVLTITGLNLDHVRHVLDPEAAAPNWLLGLRPPDEWSAMEVLVALNCVAILLAMGRAGLRYAATMAHARLIQDILVDLRMRVYDKLQRLSFRFFDSHETGTIINRATSDCGHLATFVEFAVVQFVLLIISIGVNLVYMVHIHVYLTLICMAGTPLLLVASILYSRMVRPAYEENRKLYDRLILRISENVQGRHVVNGFSLENEEIEKFHKANDDLRHQQRWLFRRTALYSTAVNQLTSLNLILVLLAGGYLVIKGNTITLGELVVFSSLLGQLSTQVASMANIANTLQVSLTAARRVTEVLSAPLGIATRPDATRLEKPQGHLVFENVTFAYNEGEPVLRNISFEVKPGQCVAILGATGSGKSALLSLIPRFYDPTEGRILLDGHDLRDLNLDDLRRSVGLVFQENFLFSNTIAFNIAFGRPESTRDEVIAAAKVAAADAFIREIPKGYDALLSEHGGNLSGGQRQRLAIARAILPQPAILLLDDATAAVDPETEHEIAAAMEAAMKGRTTFVVAHRLSTLRRADFIIVLDRGRIAEIGTHEQLMGRIGHYSEVARKQMPDPDSQWIIQARQWYMGEIDSLLPPATPGPTGTAGHPGVPGTPGNPGPGDSATGHAPGSSGGPLA